MPGANCVFPGCGVSRHSNFKYVEVFQISRRGNGNEWRTNLLGVISKYRSIDKYLKELINTEKLCRETLFPGDIEFKN